MKFVFASHHFGQLFGLYPFRSTLSLLFEVQINESCFVIWLFCFLWIGAENVSALNMYKYLNRLLDFFFSCPLYSFICAVCCCCRWSQQSINKVDLIVCSCMPFNSLFFSSLLSIAHIIKFTSQFLWSWPHCQRFSKEKYYL